MSQTITTVAIVSEGDLVFLRQRTRRTAELLGFSTEDQTRIATAVSEIGRNALSYGGGGKAELALAELGQSRTLIIRITDKGPGIADLSAVLEGRYHSIDGMGLGVTGARRLMDEFRITTSSEGTAVEMAKTIGRGNDPLSVVAIVDRLARDSTSDPALEIRIQNQELLRALETNAQRQKELARVNLTLEETNKDMLALYVELDRRAEQLQTFNDFLETSIASALAARDRSEAQLRQAQKMEAVGQLTGGLAHDFNNLLAAISGNLQLLGRRVAQGRLTGIEKYLDNAGAAAQRAAALTQRLLAFSRRQTLDPHPTDVNKLLTGMQVLIRGSVGPNIELEIVGGIGLWTARVDATQLESAILNLCINARDAMAPDGGRITIESANKWLDERNAAERELPAGQYLSICVTDTGCGMTPEVMTHAFDPFYTTKPIGQGTGLGLSMVYGFARQSGGQVRIYSEIGKGTTMCLYLPRHLGSAETEEQVPLALIHHGGGETILVIDDEAPIRAMLVEILHECGYTTLEAADGPGGLKILQSGAHLDLLITDVGLPGGMNGRQIADAARVMRPGLKVLFITGYAENAVLGNGQLEPGMEVVTKPFDMNALADKVRDLIDQ